MNNEHQDQKMSIYSLKNTAVFIKCINCFMNNFTLRANVVSNDYFLKLLLLFMHEKE